MSSHPHQKDKPCLQVLQIVSYLDGGGGKKGWDPGAADMVEAPGCQTEGRWIKSQPSTTS